MPGSTSTGAGLEVEHRGEHDAAPPQNAELAALGDELRQRVPPLRPDDVAGLAVLANLRFHPDDTDAARPLTADAWRAACANGLLAVYFQYPNLLIDAGWLPLPFDLQTATISPPDDSACSR